MVDLRSKRIHMPVIPSAATVRRRLDEVLAEAKQLNILLRLATELEQDRELSTDDTKGGQAC